MFGPPVGLFGALRCQCRRADKGPAPGSLLSGWPVRRLPGVVGSLVCADAAGQGTEVAGGEFSLLAGVGSGDPIPLSGCGLSTLCRWQQAVGEPDSLWDE